MFMSFNYPLLAALAVGAMALALNASAAWQPNQDDQLELSVAQAILKAKEKDPGLQAWFNSAAGYAVFPKVGKAGADPRAPLRRGSAASALPAGT
jgi:hypothetical protein